MTENKDLLEAIDNNDLVEIQNRIALKIGRAKKDDRNAMIKVCINAVVDIEAMINGNKEVYGHKFKGLEKAGAITALQVAKMYMSEMMNIEEGRKS